MKTRTRKTLAVLLAALMILSLAACGKKEETATEESSESEQTPAATGLANPFKDYDSLDALNEEFGTKLSRPAAMGVSDESFSGIKDTGLAQYKFTIAGRDLTFRASNEERDFSGIYVGETTLCETEVQATSIVKGVVINVYAADDSVAARWSTPDYTYILSCTGESVYTAEEFLSLAEEFAIRSAELTEGDMEGLYDSLAGSYQDLYSQRAVMDVVSEGNRLNVLVHWGSSAMEHTEWTMTCVLEAGEVWDQGQLAYSDCTKTNVVFSESGEETDTVEFTDGNGYFLLNEDRTISWVGSPEESCQECVFEIYN